MFSVRCSIPSGWSGFPLSGICLPRRSEAKTGLVVAPLLGTSSHFASHKSALFRLSHENSPHNAENEAFDYALSDIRENYDNYITDYKKH